MEIVLFILGIIIFIMTNLYFVNEIDEFINHSKNILVLYDHIEDVDGYEDKVDYQDINEMDIIKQYDYYIIYCHDDYLNLITNYQIRKYISNCQIYACCYDDIYLNLYLKENIKVMPSINIKELINKLYDQKNKSIN